MSSAQQQPAPAGAATPASRIAELESQLARERADSSRLAQAVEKRLVEFRETVTTLRGEVRQAAADRAQADRARSARDSETLALRQEADSARADVARLEAELSRARADASASSSGARAELEASQAAVARLERELEHARAGASFSMTDLRAEVEAAHATAARLEGELAEARTGAADAASLAARVDELQRALAVAQAAAPVVAAVATATPNDDGFPEIAGLRREGAGETTPFGVRFHARRCSDRLPVDVLVVRAGVAPERLSALPLARHVNLVSALASGTARDGTYVVLEHAAGETLEHAVGRDGPTDELKALRIARQVAQGLRHAAVHGLLHGDLSPGAVRLAADDAAQVEGVGFGPMLSPSERPLTDARFAAPERLTGRSATDQRADIYSLGALLVHLLSGTPPYDGDREAVQCAHAVGRACDLRARRKNVSRTTATLVSSFLALDPADRPQDWDAALGAIESAVARVGGEPVSASWFERVTSAIAGKPAVACALAVVPVIAAGIALHLATNDDGATARAPAPHAAPARVR